MQHKNRSPLSPTLALLAASAALVACQASSDNNNQFRASTYGSGVTLGDSSGDGGSCEPGIADQFFDVNSRRSLFETHEDALTGFTMESMLHATASNSGLASNPATTHDQFMDTHNTAPGLGLGQHCDDESAVGGGPGLNGFPLECPRAEGAQIGNLDNWFAIAAVNRFDLSPSDGSNCGEARIVLSNNTDFGFRRMFTIFEAQIPNPNPECGINACAPVQEFWADLSSIDDPVVRGAQLEQAFLSGHPDLLAAGFGPFVTQQAFTFGSGQIRTNSFEGSPWTLREFKTIAVKPPAPETKPFAALTKPGPGAVKKGLLRLVQVPVAANPFGDLWNDTSPIPIGEKCRSALVDTVGNLMTDNLNTMGVSLPVDCLAAESPDTSIQDYAALLNSGAFHDAIQAEILAVDPGSELVPIDIARRAAFAGGCIGCHEQSNFGPNQNLGEDLLAPTRSIGGFVHTTEQIQEDCGDGDPSCFAISSALTDHFLPHRKSVMDTFLNSGPCCEDPEASFEPADPTPIAESEVDVAAMMETEAEGKAAAAPTTISGSPSNRAH